MAKANKGKAAAAAPVDEGTVIRRQLKWIAIVLAAGLGLGLAWWWGQDNGWGDADRAVAYKLKKGEAATMQGRPDLAEAQYAAVATRYPAHAQATHALTQWAAALQQQGKLTESLVTLQALLARLASAPDKADLKAYTLLQIGKTKKDLADLEGALATFRQVREQHPKTDWSGEAQSGIGSVYMAQRRFPEARQAYAVLIKELPGGFMAAEAQTAIGECLEAEGDMAGAARAYQRVLDKYPPPVWDTAKARLENLKKSRDAVKALGKDRG